MANASFVEYRQCWNENDISRSALQNLWLLAEGIFDVWRGDKGGHTGGVPWRYIEDAARPQATKAGAKSARP